MSAFSSSDPVVTSTPCLSMNFKSSICDVVYVYCLRTSNFLDFFLCCDAIADCSNLCNLRVSRLALFRIDLYWLSRSLSRVSMYPVHNRCFFAICLHDDRKSVCVNTQVLTWGLNVS